MKVDKYDIDFVYLWVDGSDPAWRAKRNAFVGAAEASPEVNCEGRYINNDELKFSLRSLERYAPWVRRIFIVTDNQIPEWLDTDNPRIKIIDHTEILPPESLPCFNSGLIEHYLYRIPDLAERFLYSNDDMFLNRVVHSDDFFTSEGFPIVRLSRKPFRKIRWFWREKIRRHPLKNYSAKLARASQLVFEKYGVYYTGLPHHNIDAYLKSDCRQVAEQTLREEFDANRMNRIRSREDVQRIAFSYISLAEKRGKLRYVTSRESMIVRIHKPNDYKEFVKRNPVFFCMNDSEYVSDDDRRMARIFLEKMFPEKSEFEK